MREQVLERPRPTASGKRGGEADVAPRCAFVIFGATGDLAARKLLPALYALHRSGHLHPETDIVGYGRSEWNDERLREHARRSLEEYAHDFDEEHWQALAPRLRYLRGGYGEPEGMERLRR